MQKGLLNGSEVVDPLLFMSYQMASLSSFHKAEPRSHYWCVPLSPQFNPSPDPVNLFSKMSFGNPSTSFSLPHHLYSSWTFMFICELVRSMKAWILSDFLPLLYLYCVAHNNLSLPFCSNIYFNNNNKYIYSQWINALEVSLDLKSS